MEDEVSQVTVDALRHGPERVRAAATELLLSRRGLAALRKDLKRREASIKQAVASEVLPTLDLEARPGQAPKRRFPNADARAAEVQDRLEADPEVAALLARIEEREHATALLEAELDYARDVLKGAYGVALILGGGR